MFNLSCMVIYIYSHTSLPFSLTDAAAPPDTTLPFCLTTLLTLYDL
jgi:hypothetical protein